MADTDPLTLFPTTAPASAPPAAGGDKDDPLKLFPTTTITVKPSDSGPPPDTIMPGARAFIAPAPNTTYGSILPLARDDTTGQYRWALPSSLRSMATGALDLAEGPITGNVTPEGTNLLLQGAMAGMGDPSPAYGTGGKILPTLGRNAPKPPPDAPPPLTGVSPLDPAAATAAKTSAGPTESVPPAATPPPQNMPRTVTTSDDAKTIANAYYDIAKAKGTDTSLTPEASGKMIDAAKAAGQQGQFGQAVAGKDNPLTDIQTELEKLRGQSMSLADVQEMDEAITGRINQAYRGGNDKVAGQLKDVQNAWRNIYGNAGAGDVTGGTEGFSALQPARQAWSTAMKMQDLEAIQERAAGTQNPTSSLKTGINNLINSAKSRGWSDDEIAAAKDAADRGTIGTALHMMGSRLIPYIVGAGTGNLWTAGAAHVAGEGVRSMANALAQARLASAYRVLGKGAPPPPLGSTFAPSVAPTVNPLLQGSAPALAPGAYQGATTTLPNALWPGA